MSRAKATDVSSPIALFPFIGVLLCTMGALLVVLIAVSPSAHDVAMRQAAMRLHSADAGKDSEAQRELSQIDEYVARLNEMRTAAEQRLQQGQARLSHVESHMRQLQNQLQALQIAAAELDALEKEHYDDRERAAKEVERLNQLIGQTRKAIDVAIHDASTKKRSYALVPYEGPNGTLRRPIYIECRNDELVLQPEGVSITRDDLQPPYGTGNPLASALRAARDHLISLHPGEGQNRDVEPYPLIVVRPSGLTMFGAAQKAIQNSDFDFGYELVEEDWDLKYPGPDPQLAVVEQQAIEQARIRQQVLAAAAPRAYRHPVLASTGRFEFDDGQNGPASYMGGGAPGWGGDGGGGDFAVGGTGQHGSAIGAKSGGTGSGGAGRSSTTTGNDRAGFGEHNARGHGAKPPVENEQRDVNADLALNGTRGEAAIGGAGDVDGTGGPLPTGATHPAGTASTIGGDSSLATGATRPTTLPSPGSTSQLGGNSGGGGLPTLPDGDYGQAPTDLAKARGAGWALPRNKARAVSIGRTIQVVVGHDHLTIASDAHPLLKRAYGRKTIPLKGDTVEAVDDFVNAVHEQVEAWGIAGDGMYWRPVLALHVAPGGDRRADDLARLLTNSGLELSPATTAILDSTGDSHATPR
jgi:hypothetical protein